MRKILTALLFLLPAFLMWLNCGGSPASSGTKISGVKYRAFISNGVSAGSTSAGVYILNAETDAIASTGSLISVGTAPGMMVLTPNRALTIVFSGNGTQSSDNQLSFINNAQESTAAHVILPGLTESIVVSPDSSTAYVAVPTAPVVGQAPGIVDVVSLTGGVVTAQLNLPSAHYLSIGNTGNRILAFSDNSDSIAVITPSNVNVGPTVSYIGGFDRPVAGFFSSDDQTVYVLNCGAECGGHQAGVQKLDLTSGTSIPSVGLCNSDPTPQCAGSVALVDGSTLYAAGTPYTSAGPSFPCPSGTQAQFCGQLTVFDLGSMTVTSTAAITDGYHNRIALGANGQLFIGARTCTEIIPPVQPPAGAETRGCLSIYNTLSTAVGSAPAGGVLIPAENGDVTGIQPIATREVVYVVQGQNVQGGTLYIYDATIDALEVNKSDPDHPGQIFGLIGNFVDIKTVDF